MKFNKIIDTKETEEMFRSIVEIAYKKHFIECDEKDFFIKAHEHAIDWIQDMDYSKLIQVKQAQKIKFNKPFNDNFFLTITFNEEMVECHLSGFETFLNKFLKSRNYPLDLKSKVIRDLIYTSERAEQYQFNKIFKEPIKIIPPQEMLEEKLSEISRRKTNKTNIGSTKTLEKLLSYKYNSIDMIKALEKEINISLSTPDHKLITPRHNERKYSLVFACYLNCWIKMAREKIDADSKSKINFPARSKKILSATYSFILENFPNDRDLQSLTQKQVNSIISVIFKSSS